MHFGEHITIDGYGGDYDTLNNREVVLGCFSELLGILNMHPLLDPVIIEAPDNQIKDPGGWSGYVVIAESHISIHTFPRRKFISVDVYTCQNGLDQNLIVNYFTKKFSLEDTEVNFIQRGTRYPEHNLV